MAIEKKLNFKGIQLDSAYIRTSYFATNFNANGEVKVDVFVNADSEEPLESFKSVNVEFTQKEIDAINDIVYPAIMRVDGYDGIKV